MALPELCCLAFNGRPDTRWSWVVCACAAVSQAMTMGVLFSFGVLFPVFIEHFKETREKTAWVGSLAVALVFFFGPLSGSLINRFGCRVTTVTGGVVCIVSLVTASLANSLPVLFITYSVLYGLGSSFVFASSWIVVSKYFLKRRSLALGFVGGGQGLGVMAQGPLLQFLLDTTDWRRTFRIMAGVVSSICLVALSYATVRDTNCEDVHEVRQENGQSTQEGSLQRPKDRRGKFSLDFSVCKVPLVVTVAMSAGLQHFGRLTPQIHLVKHCATLGITADSATTLFIYLGLASILGRITSGFICDLRGVNSLYVYQMAVLVQGISTLLSVFAKTYVPLAVYSFVFGLCDGAFITTLNICLLKSVDSSRRASVIALHHPVISVFLASGAPVSGLIADKTGSYVPAFLMAGGVIVVAAVIPFVLLAPCLRRSAVRVEDQGGAREEVEIGEKSAVPYADNVGFTADEAMRDDEQAAHVREQAIVVEDIGGCNNTHKAPTDDKQSDTQVAVHEVSPSKAPGQGTSQPDEFTGSNSPKSAAVNEGFMDDENEESGEDCCASVAIPNEGTRVTDEDPANEPRVEARQTSTSGKENDDRTDTIGQGNVAGLEDKEKLESRVQEDDHHDQPDGPQESNSNGEIVTADKEANPSAQGCVFQAAASEDSVEVREPAAAKAGETPRHDTNSDGTRAANGSNSGTIEAGTPEDEDVTDSENCITDTKL